jgi:predicted alpha/beta-hydrolase family hydrolase
MDFIETNSDTLDVLLHGAGGGMKHSNIQKAFDVCVKQGHSVVNFNFPYFERGEEQSSGPKLIEEVETLKKILAECKADKYKHIRLIGKSLGAIIAAKYLSSLKPAEMEKFSVIIFGYDTGMIDISTFTGKISIIQGEKDKYGNIGVVKNDLKNAASKDISFFEVSNADHSYRNEQKEPVYEDAAIEFFRKV